MQVRALGISLALALVSCAPQRQAPPALERGETPVAIERVTDAAAEAGQEALPSPSVSASADADSPPKEASGSESAAPWEKDKVGDRIGSKSFRTWIWGEPMRSRDHLAIGALRVGTSVKLKSKTPVPGQGCLTRWYAIEPRGFICADETTTFDFDSPYWKALATLRPGPGVYPYRYAFSYGAPMYSRIPSKKEQASAEYDMGATMRFKTLGKWSEGHERLISTKPEEFFKADGPIPDFYHGLDGIAGSPWNPVEPKVKVIPAGSGFAYSRIFEAEGRLWLLTPDLFLVPADRVWPYKESDFHGTELDDAHQPPFAWVRAAEGAPKLSEEAGGAFAAKGETFEGRKPVFLTGERRVLGKITYHQTRDGDWLADDDAVTVVPVKTTLKYNVREDEKWLEASILGGVMTAYIGKKPVFTTLWSPGLGGVPVKGNDPKKFATTETGIFPIQWKDAVETMSPDKGAPKVFWFADVPWIQYVKAPMAMHVSYWHENFGYPMSAECLNTSATDGQWLFGFTDPKLPEDWGSVGAGRVNGPSTRIVINP